VQSKKKKTTWCRIIKEELQFMETTDFRDLDMYFDFNNFLLISSVLLYHKSLINVQSTESFFTLDDIWGL
jgi:hypothetical protein